LLTRTVKPAAWTRSFKGTTDNSTLGGQFVALAPAAGILQRTASYGDWRFDA